MEKILIFVLCCHKQMSTNDNIKCIEIVMFAQNLSCKRKDSDTSNDTANY